MPESNNNSIENLGLKIGFSEQARSELLQEISHHPEGSEDWLKAQIAYAEYMIEHTTDNQVYRANLDFYKRQLQNITNKKK